MGYFEGSAAISVPSGTDLAIASPDFKAMLDNSRLVVVSEANDLVYSASVTQRTVDNFTASVRIYKNGVYVRSATMTGVDNTVSKTVSGTFSGTGDYASGTFSLTYNSTINARAPLVFADTNNRYDAPPIASVIYFTSNTTADIALASGASSDNLDSCDMTNTTLNNVNSEQPGRIRQFSGVLAGCSTNATNGAAAQGYFTSFDHNGGTDNALLFVLFNDSDAQISVLDCQNDVCPP